LDGRPYSGNKVTLQGGSGKAILIGGSGNHTLIGGGNANLLVAGTGDQYLVGGQNASASNILAGGTGLDTLKGGKGYNTLISGSRVGGYNLLIADGVANSLVAGLGNDTLFAVGYGGDTTMVGGTGKVIMAGGKGFNSLVSGSESSGSNTLLAGIGSNTLVAGLGRDILKGGDNKDVFLINQNNIRNHTIIGGEGIDTLSLGSVSNLSDSDFSQLYNVELLQLTSSPVLGSSASFGSAANKAGLSSIIGGSGNDTINASSFGRTSYINGGNGNDLITGGSDADTIIGGTGDDSLLGGSGDNSLIGGAGKDTMIGGEGNDTFMVDAVGDVVREDAGAGTDVVISSIDYDLSTNGSNIENLNLTGNVASVGTGNSLDNVINGNAVSNSLSGLDGDDTIYGGLGNDTINGGEGNDYIDGDATSQVKDAAGFDTTYIAFDPGSVATNELSLAQAALDSSSGISIINAQYTGSNNSAAFVSKGINWGTIGGREVRQSQGIVLSTGNAISGSSNDGAKASNQMNTPGSYLLADILNSTFSPTTQSKDASTLEFTFEVTDTSAKYISMDIVFASEEFPEFTQLFPDIAAVFIDGINVALFNKDPKAPLAALKRNVDNGYFIDNTSGELSTIYDGVTSSLTFAGELGQGQNGQHTIKIVIADTNDRIYNSAVYVSNIKAVATLPVIVTSTNDSLLGGAGNDTILGNGGDDTLDGGTGIDSLIGGVGDDTYFVDDSGDTVTEKAGEGTDLVFSTASHTLGANLENLTYSNDGTNSATLTGNELANSIDGSSVNDTSSLTLQGGDGNDTLIVRADRIGGIEGGNGTDTVIFKGTQGITLDDSAFQGAAGIENYDYSQVSGNLNITLGAISQAKGITSLNGGAGNDSLSAPTYTVGIQLDGKDGNDSLTGGNANDTLIGGSGNNTLNGGNGDDLLIITPALVNPSSLDTVNGGNGSDTLQVSLASATLVDSLFSAVSDIEVLQATSGNNSFTIGTEASRAGIRTVYGAAGNDTIDATSYTTGVTLIGGEGANSLTGGSGADSLVAGLGDDTLSGGAGKDTLDAGAGVNSLSGGDDDDTFLFSTTPLLSTQLDGGAGTADTILFTASGVTLGDGVFGNVKNTEVLQLGGGNNSALIGATAKTAGIRTIIGGTARNTLSAAGDISTAAILLNASASSASSLVGGRGADQLLGGSGRDTLDGGDGGDAMQGGDGNDFYYYNENTDIITEYGGGGIDTVFSSIDYVLGNSIEVGQLTGVTGKEDLNLKGNRLNNTLIGNDGDNVLDDGEVSISFDVMQGGKGNDTYIVRTEIHEITEKIDEGTDVIESYDDFILPDYVEKIILVEGAINARAATGNASGNTLVGNSIANTLDGSGGADTMLGGLGDDTYVVDNTGDIMIESVKQGRDLVQVVKTGNLTKETMIGGVNTAITTFILADGNNIENLQYVGIGGNAFLTGNELDNSILGGRGKDTLRGGASGNDTLNGGEGDDFLSGGYGDDYYVVDSALDIVDEKANAGSDTVDASVSYTLSGGVEYLVLSGSGNLDGTGSTDDNTLIGNNQNNRLDGSRGADSMAGGRGDDVYVVDDLGDRVLEITTNGEGIQQGTDLVYSSVDYALGDNVENLILTGTGNINGIGNSTGTNVGVRANSLIGNSGDNILTGGAGNDTLDGGAGADNMSGGAGNDIYIVDNAGDTVFDVAGTDSVYSSITYNLAISATGVENLYLTGSSAIDGTGNDDNNLIVGNGAVNALDGGEGNDTLDGGAGADNMTGGTGDDIYIVDNAGDTVVEDLTLALGGGTDTVRTLVNFDISGLANVENITHLGSANLKSIGNDLGNVMTGNEGIDTMTGGAGNDTYILNNTTDVVTEAGGQGTDEIQSSATYILSDNVERLVLTGLANINGTGNALDNTLIGNIGNNSLDGAGGADFMAGGAGNDTYTIDNAGDVVFESINNGIDTIISNQDWTLSGNKGANVENLILSGGANINGTGNAQANQIIGNSGDNTLDGGIGTNGVDTLTGQGGADTFILGNASTSYYTASSDLDYSIITDFSTADGDKLVLNGSSNLYVIGSLDGTAAQGLNDNYSGLYRGDDLIAAINKSAGLNTSNLSNYAI
jgi:Ca2+-binding RTX toxin-like protein